MTLREFLNALRILRSIDRAELIDAGLELHDKEWMDFRGDPYRWLCLASGERPDRLWAIVQGRMTKRGELGNG